MLLRALGALLIINSHVEPLYPVRQLAFGGLIGDSLFFFLSGFGLACSGARCRRPFFGWYGRRVARIYPSVILVVLVFDGLLRWPGGLVSWQALLRNAAGWGPDNSFVGQIMILYVLLYGALQIDSRWLLRLFLLLFVPYAAIPLAGHSAGVFHAFHWLYYFQQMIFGAWLAQRPELAPGAGRGTVALLAGVFLAQVACKLALVRGWAPDWFFFPHLTTFALVYLLLRAARSPEVARVLNARRGTTLAINLLAAASLETYLVHYQVLPRISGRAWGFPLGLIAFLVLSIVFGCLLAAFTARLRPWLARLGAHAHPGRIFGSLSGAQKSAAAFDGASVSQ